MKASVIIPIYNSEVFLGELFHCLDSVQFENGDEVILVDNGSSDSSFQMCIEYATDKANLVKVIQYNEKAGSYSARNHAVDYAKGDLLVFTDSDCKPVPKWIKVIKDSIEPGTVISGNVILEVLYGGVWEVFDSLTGMHNDESAKNGSVATANMAVLKKDFEAIGKFEERFSGGDYEWSQRAVGCGYKVKFCKDAIVYHPTRKTYREIANKQIRIAYGVGKHYKFKKKSIVSLALLYSLRVLYFKTNYAMSKKLIKNGVKIRDLFEFNYGFEKIRFLQISSAIKGYKGLNPRKYGIK